MASNIYCHGQSTASDNCTEKFIDFCKAMDPQSGKCTDCTWSRSPSYNGEACELRLWLILVGSLIIIALVAAFLSFCIKRFLAKKNETPFIIPPIKVKKFVDGITKKKRTINREILFKRNNLMRSSTNEL
jgi:hypothetical protein